MKENWLRNHSPDGYGDADERNRNSKNQKSRRRVNRTGVKKTHLVIIPSPEDTKKRTQLIVLSLRPASIRSRETEAKTGELHASTFFLASLGILSERKGKKKIEELTRLDRNR